MATRPAERPLERYFARYSADHRNALNQRIHCVAVPAMLWAVVALLWCLPVAGTWFKTGVWAGLAMFAAWSWYNRLSRSLGYGMVAVFFTAGCLCRLLEARMGLPGLRWLGLAVLVAGAVAQLVGHRIEGRRPSFLDDIAYLLIGPVWVLARVYRSMGWRY